MLLTVTLAFLRHEEQHMTATIDPQLAAVDRDKIHALLDGALADLGATVTTAMISIGDRVGLFKSLADGGPATPAELAERTGTVERYVREWLPAVAAAGYAEYDPDSGRFSLSPEQAAVLANESAPFRLAGGFESVLAAVRAEPLIAERFRTGDGLAWAEHDPRLFDGTERFFGGLYTSFLVGTWIAALDGVEAKLESGARVADVGCGHGASTILMAQAFPASTFAGFDSHAASIDRATEAAADAGVSDRVSFEVAGADAFAGAGYDLITHLDCLHDMGDPLAAARQTRAALAEDGTWMIVEPRAGDRIEENLNPIGRLSYGMSTLICTPHALSETGESALGGQAGEARIRSLAEAAGFRRFQRASESPFNFVYEARP